jgi:hypothetical protein
MRPWSHEIGFYPEHDIIYNVEASRIQKIFSLNQNPLYISAMEIINNPQSIPVGSSAYNDAKSTIDRLSEACDTVESCLSLMGPRVRFLLEQDPS